MSSADLPLGQALLVLVRERDIALTALGTDPHLISSFYPHINLVESGTGGFLLLPYSPVNCYALNIATYI